MAQDQTDKRRNIATNAVFYATQLWDSLNALKELAAEHVVAGNFEDADFEVTDLKHLTPFMIGSLLDIHVPAIYDFVTDSGTPAREDTLLGVRR